MSTTTSPPTAPAASTVRRQARWSTSRPSPTLTDRPLHLRSRARNARLSRRATTDRTGHQGSSASRSNPRARGRIRPAGIARLVSARLWLLRHSRMAPRKQPRRWFPSAGPRATTVTPHGALPSHPRRTRLTTCPRFWIESRMPKYARARKAMSAFQPVTCRPFLGWPRMPASAVRS